MKGLEAIHKWTMINNKTEIKEKFKVGVSKTKDKKIYDENSRDSTNKGTRPGKIYLNGNGITTINDNRIYIWKYYEVNVNCSKIKIHLKNESATKYKNSYYTAKYSRLLRDILDRNSIKVE
jgi:hypothetical protein